MNDEQKLANFIAIDNFSGALELIGNKVGGINSTDKSGATLLMRAVVCNDIPMIKKLLSYGANVNAVDNQSLTALHFAAQDANISAARELINSGANVNAQDKWGNIPLLRTPSEETEGGHIISEFLKNHGSNISLENNYGVSYENMSKQ